MAMSARTPEEASNLIALLNKKYRLGGTVATAGYWLGQGIGRMIAVWPIMKFMRKV